MKLRVIENKELVSEKYADNYSSVYFVNASRGTQTFSS